MLGYSKCTCKPSTKLPDWIEAGVGAHFQPRSFMPQSGSLVFPSIFISGLICNFLFCFSEKTLPTFSMKYLKTFVDPVFE